MTPNQWTLPDGRKLDALRQPDGRFTLFATAPGEVYPSGYVPFPTAERLVSHLRDWFRILDAEWSD